MNTTNISSREKSKPLHFSELKRKAPSGRKCNICDKPFHPHTKFERFCENCRVTSQTYHYSDWLTG